MALEVSSLAYAAVILQAPHRNVVESCKTPLKGSLSLRLEVKRSFEMFARYFLVILLTS